MRRRDFLLSTGTALAVSGFPCRWVSAGGNKPQKLLYFTRSAGFEHSVVTRKGKELSHSERILTELGKRAGFDVLCTKDGGVFDGDLDQFDAIAFYTSGVLTEPDKQNDPPMTAKGKQRLLDAIAAGKGFVSYHASSDSFHTPGAKDENQPQPDPYLAMLGGEFIIHGKQQEALLKVTAPDFPGVKGWGQGLKLTEEWYALKNFAPDLHVILLLDTAGMEGPMYQRKPFPNTWARRHGQGRVWHSALGHREDIWTNPQIQDLFLGGIAWAMGNVQADVTPNFDQVAPGARDIPKLPPNPPKKKPASGKN